MRLSHKLYAKLNKLQLDIIEELSFHTTKLYNIANYECREQEYKNYYVMEKVFKGNWHNEYLQSHCYQQALRVLDKDWKSFFKASKEYKKHPEKYLGTPQPPKYKNLKNRKNQIIFTRTGIREKDGFLALSLSKAVQKKFDVKSLNLELPSKVQERLNIDISALQQVKISWDNSRREWYLILIYKQEEVEIDNSFQNIMAIDLGLDNLCALTFRNSKEQYLINGKTIKSRNAYFNKEIARLEGIRMKQVGGSKKYISTKQIIKLQKKRNDYIHDALHKASRKVIDIAMEQKCNIIVIGDMSGVKQNNPAKSFVQVPVQRLAELIKYKAKLLGITVKMFKEHYTSGTSAYDLEPVDKDCYDKTRRILRGVFVTNEGLKVNSDINGSLNILRKYCKNNVVPMSIARLRDNGCLDHPIRIRVA